jgi:hypothetical protein
MNWRTFAEIKSDMDQKQPVTDQRALIIAQTQKWIERVVIGNHFCPFAARELNRNSIFYQVDPTTDLKGSLEAFMRECTRLDEDSAIATTLLILPNAFTRFADYLGLVDLAEKLLKQSGYEGTYQVASFHPLYRFAGAKENDPANYTNRSLYPMLHLLREEGIDQALLSYPDPEGIPTRNIEFARGKGEEYMKMLRESCF